MSLELNGNKNRVAVAGRRGKFFVVVETLDLRCTLIYFRFTYLTRYAFSAFKIFSIDDGTFVEDVDLRGTDTVNLNYSFTDVTWNLKDGELSYSNQRVSFCEIFSIPVFRNRAFNFRTHLSHRGVEWRRYYVEFE